jgi:hypothetical protein
MSRANFLLHLHDVDRGNFGLPEGRKDPNSCGHSMQGHGWPTMRKYWSENHRRLDVAGIDVATKLSSAVCLCVLGLVHYAWRSKSSWTVRHILCQRSTAESKWFVFLRFRRHNSSLHATQKTGSYHRTWSQLLSGLNLDLCLHQPLHYTGVVIFTLRPIYPVEKKRLIGDWTGAKANTDVL